MPAVAGMIARRKPIQRPHSTIVPLRRRIRSSARSQLPSPILRPSQLRLRLGP